MELENSANTNSLSKNEESNNNNKANNNTINKQETADKNKEFINKIFNEMTDDRILSWENNLLNENKTRNLTLKDSDILNITNLNEKASRVIKNDIERTRVAERNCLESFKDLTFKLITYYLKKTGIDYKQGMNEIAGPFILLKYKIDISISRLYKMFACFIDRFLTNYYSEKDFYSLQSSLALVNILLRYHDPELYMVLEYSMINPEMYATSWILTLFANKCSLDVTYHLWDKIILFDDNMMLHYFIVAYLMTKRNLVMKEDSSIIPSILSQLRIQDIDEVNQALDIAIELRDKTPFSFRIYSEKLEIFKYKSTKLKELYEKYSPDTIVSMPMFPTEVLNITYRPFIGCVDENCKNFDLKRDDDDYDDIDNNKSDDNKIISTTNNFSNNINISNKIDKINDNLNISEISSINNNANNNLNKNLNNSTKKYKPKYKKCFYCENKVHREDLTYIILDFRNLENTNETVNSKSSLLEFPGFLPMTIKIEKSELLDINFPKNFLDNYSKENGNFHFILMTNETDYFKNFEEIYYKEGDKKKPAKFGIVHKIYKELNFDKANELFKKDNNSKESINLREFNNLRKMLFGMLKQNFKYVSFVYGGYLDIHSLAMKYNIDLLDHGLKCVICENEKEKEKNNTIMSKIENMIGLNKFKFSYSLPINFNKNKSKSNKNDNVFIKDDKRKGTK